MMKNYAIAVISAAPCLVAAAPASTVEEYTAVLEEQTALAQELTDVLVSVTDKESADAAAVKLAVIFEKGEALKAKEEALGELSPGMESALGEVLENWYLALIKLSMTTDSTLKRILDNGFYGSEPLKQLLTSQLESTQTIESEPGN